MGHESTSGFLEPQKTMADNRKDIAFLKRANSAGNRPYTTYVGLLRQSGTAIPTITILENTLGFVPVWSRTSAGEFVITAPTGGFPQLLTTSNISNASADPTWVVQDWYRDDDSRAVATYKAGVAADGVFDENMYEIRVYSAA